MLLNDSFTPPALQREVADWAEQNFDHSIRYHPLLGMVEEVGELAHAILKKEQGIRGTEEELDEKARDALGDITIYLVDYASRNDITLTFEFPELNESVEREEIISLFFELVRNMGWAAEDWLADLPTETDLQEFMYIMSMISDAYGWNYSEIVQETWESVSGRDWVTNPETGVV